MAIVHESQVLYTIKPGDTVYSIATRFGSSVSMIQNANALYPPFTDPFLIFPGWLLIVPTPTIQPMQSIYIITAGDALYTIAQRFSVPVDLLARMNSHIQNPNQIFIDQSLAVPSLQYEVVQGDTLARIAERMRIPTQQIIRANERRPGFSLDVLFPGYRLIIPSH